MKKTFLLALCLLTFAATKAQTYSSAHITVVISDTMYHDSTQCASFCNANYIITVDSSFVGDTVNIVDTTLASLVGSYANTTGASPWTFTAPIYSTPPSGYNDLDIYGGYSHFGAGTTKITCTIDTLRYVTYNDSLLVTNPCIYNMVSGTVYADMNGNCVFDSGDVGIVAPEVDFNETLSSPVGSIFEPISSTGAYYGYPIQQSWMTSYTVSLPAYFSFIFPNSPCAVGIYTLTTLPASGIDFPLLCTTNIDVECYAFSPASVRLHTPFYMQPFVNNTGCDTAAGELTLVIDPRVSYDSALSTYPPDTVRGDTLIWNYHSLNNLSGSAYWNSFFSDLYLTPDTAVAVGDTLCFRVYTNILAADVNPANNDYSFCLPVVYSYDPNEKDVTPKGDGPQGFIHSWQDTLTYNVHFQNTGSDYAYNVTIIDTLDSHINASTFKIIGTSHNMTPQWLAPGIVQFNFNNIMLPDSGTNQAASQGEVRFSAVLNPGLAPGTQIKNTGYIYFDSNPAVVTNTTLNTIAIPTKITPATNLPVKVYPNPAIDHITIENLDGGEISILNMNGSVIMTQHVTSNKTSIEVSGLPDGVYILKTVNNTNTTTTKFTKY